MANALPPRVPSLALAIDLLQEATAYRNQFVYTKIQQKMRVVKLQQERASRLEFEREAVQNGVVLITGTGHGGKDAYGSDKRKDDILKVGHYSPQEVRGRVVHLFSCFSAVELGPDLVRNGALAFFGYSGKFTLMDRNYIQIFFECDSEIDLALADGMTAQEVHVRTINKFDRIIERLTREGHTDVARDLSYNLPLLRTPVNDPFLGNRYARLR